MPSLLLLYTFLIKRTHFVCTYHNLPVFIIYNGFNKKSHNGTQSHVTKSLIYGGVFIFLNVHYKIFHSKQYDMIFHGEKERERELDETTDLRRYKRIINIGTLIAEI